MRPHAAANRFRLERSGVGVVVIEVSECMRLRPVSNPGSILEPIRRPGEHPESNRRTRFPLGPPLDSLSGSMARTLNVKPVIFAFAAPFSLR